MFITSSLQLFLWTHSLISLWRGPYTLKDTSFLHGVELLDGIILLVEVSIGLFPGLCYCVLLGKVRIIPNSPPFLIYPKQIHHSGKSSLTGCSSFCHLEGDGCEERQAESNGQVKSQTLGQQPPHHWFRQRHDGSVWITQRKAHQKHPRHWYTSSVAPQSEQNCCFLPQLWLLPAALKVTTYQRQNPLKELLNSKNSFGKCTTVTVL